MARPDCLPTEHTEYTERGKSFRHREHGAPTQRAQSRTRRESPRKIRKARKRRRTWSLLNGTPKNFLLTTHYSLLTTHYPLLPTSDLNSVNSDWELRALCGEDRRVLRFQDLATEGTELRHRGHGDGCSRPVTRYPLPLIRYFGSNLCELGGLCGEVE